MKKCLIILMFAVITPATQSCQFLANVLNWQYGNVYYQYPRNDKWNWFNPVANNSWNGNSIQVDFSQSNLPRNWNGSIFAPAPAGYYPQRATCSYNNGRYFMNIFCDQGRNLYYEFSSPRYNTVRWY